MASKEGEVEQAILLDVTPSDLNVNPAVGLTDDEAVQRLATVGPNELPKKKKNKFLQFLSFFMNPLSYIMAIAAFLSVSVTGIGGSVDYPDFIGIIILLFVNAIIGFIEETKAADAVEALMASLSLEARARRQSHVKIIPARELVPGDIILVKLGDIVPADAAVITCENIKVDQSAMTGESLPVSKREKEILYSGCIIKQGEAEAVVIATGTSTFFGKAAALVDRREPQVHFQVVLFRIGLFCVGLILVSTIAIIVVMFPAFKYTFHRGINNILVLLIGGVPIAMPTVLSVTMSIGAHGLAKFKAIVRRVTAVEELAAMDILCSDKTGTLTKNKLEISKGLILPFNGFSVDDVILFSARAARMENQDAIDLAIVNQLGDSSSARANIEELHFLPFDPAIKRTQITYIDNGTQKTMRVSKGAPQIIRDMCDMDDASRDQVTQKIDSLAKNGYRALGVMICEVPDGTRGEELSNAKWAFVGVIPIYDPPHDDSVETIRKALDLGVQVKMITGDQLAIGKETARLLGMGTNVYDISILRAEAKHQLERHSGYTLASVLEGADGVAGVLPEDKYDIVRELMDAGHVCGMTGDGVNDAPALKKANIGIAVSDATDAARSASDIVLTKAGLSVIITAIEGARIIFQRMRSYALFATATTVRIVLSFSIMIFAWKYDPVPFLVLILALLNDGTIMTISTDRTKPSQTPDKWKLGEIFFIATCMGLYLTLSTLLFFHVVFETNFPRELGLSTPWLSSRNPNHYQLHSLVYMQISISGQALIFSTRSAKLWFMERPSLFLIIAFGVAQTVATLLAVYANWGFAEIEGVGWGWALFVWIWNLAWFIPIDLPKIAAKEILKREVWLNRTAYHEAATKVHLASPIPSIHRGSVDAQRHRASIDSTIAPRHREFMSSTLQTLRKRWNQREAAKTPRDVKLDLYESHD